MSNVRRLPATPCYPLLNSAPQPVHFHLFGFPVTGRTLWSPQFEHALPFPPVPPCGGIFISQSHFEHFLPVGVLWNVIAPQSGHIFPAISTPVVVHRCIVCLYMSVCVCLAESTHANPRYASGDSAITVPLRRRGKLVSWHQSRLRTTRRLTLPSRGCPKGCAFCAPLMSNVRRRKYSATCDRSALCSPPHGAGI